MYTYRLMLHHTTWRGVVCSASNCGRIRWSSHS